MGTIALAVEEFVAADPAVVFGRFGRDSGAGRLFGAARDRVAVGEPVTLRAPIAGGPPVDVLGRISELRGPRTITITHDQPWRGRIRLRFAPRTRQHPDPARRRDRRAWAGVADAPPRASGPRPCRHRGRVG